MIFPYTPLTMKRLTPLLAVILLLSACTSTPPDSTTGDSSSSALSSIASSTSSTGATVLMDVVVDSPLAGATIKSPLTITGRAKGTWYFEATFPIRLLDSSGNEIATTHADAQGEWMTEDFVPFTATLEFTATPGSGTLVMQKDNPSGDPVNDKSVSVPVSF